MDPLTLIAAVTVGGVLIGGGVHFVPVGGAPAAMATATGVGTGTAMLAAGAGLTGLITAASMSGQPVYMVMAAGAVGSMLMIGITMVIANLIYVFGVGTVPASGKADIDPITKLSQEEYRTPGTEGHGVPTVCFVSGLIGGACGGIGGGLIYWALNEALKVPELHYGAAAAGLAAIFATGVFFVNSVVASYNIGGTIEGFHDPKFKRLPKGVLACFIVSLILAVTSYLLIFGGAF